MSQVEEIEVVTPGAKRKMAEESEAAPACKNSKQEAKEKMVDGKQLQEVWIAAHKKMGANETTPDGEKVPTNEEKLVLIIAHVEQQLKDRAEDLYACAASGAGQMFLEGTTVKLDQGKERWIQYMVAKHFYEKYNGLDVHVISGGDGAMTAKATCWVEWDLFWKKHRDLLQ